MDISDISDISDTQQQQQESQQQGIFNQQNPINHLSNNFTNMSTAEIHEDHEVTTDIDIDSELLQQFSCLGTTDHEDLIKNLQRIFNDDISKYTAKFFLEMCNWNLQTAVCSYLDFCNVQNLPSMKIVQQTSSEYQKSWRLQNDGNEEWPSGCYLTSPSQTNRVELPTIKPGETCDLIAELPPYCTTNSVVMWRLYTPNGWCFGETIWMIPDSSMDETAADLAQRMSQLRTSPASPMISENSPQINVKIITKMD